MSKQKCFDKLLFMRKLLLLFFVATSIAFAVDDEEMIKRAKTYDPDYFVPIFRAEIYSDATLGKILTALKSRAKREKEKQRDTSEFLAFFDAIHEIEHLDMAIRSRASEAGDIIRPNLPAEKVIPWELPRFLMEKGNSEIFYTQFRNARDDVRAGLRQELMSRLSQNKFPTVWELALLELFAEIKDPPGEGISEKARRIILNKFENARSGSPDYHLWFKALMDNTPANHTPSSDEIAALAKFVRKEMAKYPKNVGGHILIYRYLRQLKEGALENLYRGEDANVSQDASILMPFGPRTFFSAMSDPKRPADKEEMTKVFHFTRRLGKFGKSAGLRDNIQFATSDGDQVTARKWILRGTPEEAEMALEILLRTATPDPHTYSAILAATGDDRLPKGVRERAAQEFLDRLLTPSDINRYDPCNQKLMRLAIVLRGILPR